MTEPDPDLEGAISKTKFFIAVAVIVVIAVLVLSVTGCQPKFDPYPGTDYPTTTATPTQP